MDLQLSGKTALVTGGSRGIGRAIARALAAEGVRVAICARTAEAVDATAREIAAQTGTQLVAITADTGTRDAVLRMVEYATEELGSIDILVNNAATAAGRGRPPALAEISREALLAEIDVKVLGYLFAAQAVAPAMAEAGWGRIINIAGLAARTTGSTIGSIRNVAVSAMTKNLADELGPQGVTVTCVHPGLTVTERVADDPAYLEQAARNGIARPVTADDVAVVVAFLASPRAAATNGAIISLDGGRPGPIWA
jgi:NAD(P)-dependent dehydrogenase (short-subunit alcohol dehydrogenase family)